ncbi:hypothetical protein OKW39_001925 [Paraburkholderia sp. MM6662-R1]
MRYANFWAGIGEKPRVACRAIRLMACTLLFLLAHTPVLNAQENDHSGYGAAPQSTTDWNQRVSGATVKQDDPLVLVIHSARDCTWCARWMGFLGGKHDFESWAQGRSNVGLLVVERDAIAGVETSANYPPEAQWMFEWARHIGNLKPRTPTFEIYVGRTVVWRSAGYYSWARSVFPALKELEGRRAAADESSPPGQTLSPPRE